MPISTAALEKAGRAALDYFQRNPPTDQIQVNRPWIRKLRAMKKSFPGGKQNVVQQLRKAYGANFTWYYGDQTVTFNKRDTLAQGMFPWRSCHDGFSLNEDELAANGIVISATSGRTRLNAMEISRLTNILEENFEVLRLGFDEKLDQALLASGSTNADAITGLDGLITLIPTAGKVGGIDRATASNAWWRNNVQTGLTQATMIDHMETQFRKCVRTGGVPDFIQVGQTYLDSFRKAAKGEIDQYTIKRVSGGGAAELDPGIGNAKAWGVETGLHFKNVPMYWNPVFEDLDAALGPATAWEKRCYFINCRFLQFRPMEGYNGGDGEGEMGMAPRVYDRYTYYWFKKGKFALTLGKSNAHSVLAMA